MFKASPPIRNLSITLIASICIGELIVMLILPFFGELSFYADAILDVTLLSCITVPMVIWTMTRPMNQNYLALIRARARASQSEMQMLSALNSLALARDNETGQHILRTQEYVRLIARRLQKMGQYSRYVTDEFIEKLVKVAPLHDVGKVGIPDSILTKAGPLSKEEREVMNTHTSIGENILSLAKEKGDGSGLMAVAAIVAGNHHEKWDGSGYPRKRRGQDIPLEARIMSLADMYDALMSPRIYKDAWSFDQAYEEILCQKGSSFDPVIVDAFVAERSNFEAIALKYADAH
jgi:response regulator RpfG family c-di-GMP phosphodiesterase